LVSNLKESTQAGVGVEGVLYSGSPGLSVEVTMFCFILPKRSTAKAAKV